MANAGDGTTYAIPTNSLLTPEGSFMLFKKEYIEKYNIDLSNVVRLRDVTEILKVIKENEPGIKPVEKPVTTIAEVDFYGHEYSIIGADNSEIEWLAHAVPGYGFRTAQAKDHFELMSEWRYAGYFTLRGPYPEDAENDVLLAPVPGDDEADWFMTVREGSYYDIPKWEEEGFEVVIHRSPEYTTENSLKTFYGISVNSRLPDRCMEILKMMTTEPELKNLLQYGIPEVHYSLNEDGVTISKLSDDYTMDFYGTGNTFIGYIPEEMGAEYVKNALELSKVAKINAYIGFDPELTEEEQKAFDKLSEYIHDKYIFLCQGLESVNAELGDIATDINALLEGIAVIDPDAFVSEFGSKHTDCCRRLVEVSAKIRPTANDFDFISDREAFNSSVNASRAEDSIAYSVIGSVDASVAQSKADASAAAAQ